MTAQPLPHPEAPPTPSDRPRHSGNRPPGAITCNGCDRWWTGLASAHCSACHETFTGVTIFGVHRRNGQCLKPPDVGLVVASRVWFGWSSPATDWRGPTDDDTDE